MSADGRTSTRSARRQWRLAVGALVLTQVLDLTTTLYGLRSSTIVELNPVVSVAMAELGRLPGLLCMASLSVVVVATVTEAAVRRTENAWLTAGRIRCFGYGPHVVVSLAAALNNLYVIWVY